jgi:tRNA pseudouridine(55) synthase
MGFITRQSPTLSSTYDLSSALANFPAEYEQRIPDFSARRWNGASGFDAAKQLQEIERKKRMVRINGLALLGSEVLCREQIQSAQQRAVSAVIGDFRQAEILDQWQQTNFICSTFLITHHVVQTSPGTYIRQLVQDLAEHIGVSATTWAITRTKNGPYEKLDT